MVKFILPIRRFYSERSVGTKRRNVNSVGRSATG